jgi:hypothetical protein
MHCIVDQFAILPVSIMVNGRTSLAYSSKAKSAVRSALALLGAKLWTFKLWLSKSAVSLPLTLTPCLPLNFHLPGATPYSMEPPMVAPGSKGVASVGDA